MSLSGAIINAKKKTMNKIHIHGIVRKVAENKYRVLASTSAYDRQGDSIDQSGWMIANYLKNPVMLWAHEYSELPVAKATGVDVTSRGLELSFEFAPAEANPKAAQVKMLYDQGFLNAVSVGFIAHEQNGSVITRSELLEVSFVPVPCNQEALKLGIKKGLDVSLVSKDISEKGEVSEILDAQEVMEAKYENINEVFEIVYAFCEAYCDPANGVNDFSKLLAEAVGLLSFLATNGSDEMSEKAQRSERAKAWIAAEESRKEGRTLSGKTLEKLTKALSSMDDASGHMRDLIKGADAGREDVAEESKNAVIPKEELKEMQSQLRINDRQIELSLSVISKWMAGKK